MCFNAESDKLLKAFSGVYIPMHSPEQDHIRFTTPIFIAIQNCINVKRLKTTNCITENLPFNIIDSVL